MLETAWEGPSRVMMEGRTQVRIRRCGRDDADGCRMRVAQGQPRSLRKQSGGVRRTRFELHGSSDEIRAYGPVTRLCARKCCAV